MDIKIKKGLLDTVYGLIHPKRVTLKPNLSRFRRRFLQELEKELKLFYEDKNEIIMEYVPKDEEGKPIWGLGEEGEMVEGYLDPTKLEQETLEKFTKDYNQLLNEEFVFEIKKKDKLRVKILDALKIIFLTLDIEFDSQTNEENVYDEFCEDLGIGLDETYEDLIESLHKSLGE